MATRQKRFEVRIRYRRRLRQDRRRPHFLGGRPLPGDACDHRPEGRGEAAELGDGDGRVLLAFSPAYAEGVIRAEDAPIPAFGELLDGDERGKLRGLDIDAGAGRCAFGPRAAGPVAVRGESMSGSPAGEIFSM